MKSERMRLEDAITELETEIHLAEYWCENERTIDVTTLQGMLELLKEQRTMRLALDIATGKGSVVKGRRMTDSESMGMLFDDAPDIPNEF